MFLSRHLFEDFKTMLTHYLETIQATNIYFYIFPQNIYIYLIDMTAPLILKRPRGRAVSAPDFGSWGRGFESRWRRDSSRT